MLRGRTDVTLYPEYYNGKTDRILELYRQLEDYIMKDIAARLLKSGEMSGTADRLIWKLRQMGEHKSVIIKKLAQLTGLTTAELKTLLQEAVLTSWEDDVSVFDALDVQVSDPLENPTIMSVMDAEYQKSLAELQNLTRTTMEKSQQDLINMLDEAEMRVSSGVQSYSAAVCDILDRYAGQGVKVSYPTGAEISLEAAVRMCVVTSMNQTAAQVTNQYIAETKTNYVLTSAHIGARVKRDGQPDLAGHDLWQGSVFCIVGSEPDIPNLLESTGYDIDPLTGQGKVVNPLGMHGYNCRHGHRPWDKRLRNPWRDKDGNLIDGNGELITSERNRKAYENQQKQRAYERAIRKTKRELLVKQQEIDGVAETDVKSILQEDYDKLAYKLRQQNKVYNDFCEKNDLQRQSDRIKVSGFARAQSSRANGRATAYKNKIGKTEPVANKAESDIIKQNIDSGTVKLEINKNKQNRHIKDSSGYLEGRSYIYGDIQDAQNLVNDLHGTGTPVLKPDGTWANKELVTANDVIGVNVNPKTFEETETSKATIHYSKTGTHIIPRKGE